MRINNPKTRLQNFDVGSTVKLIGAEYSQPKELQGAIKNRSFYFGESKDGYAYLWKSLDHFEKGKPWEVVASLGHAASKP